MDDASNLNTEIIRLKRDIKNLCKLLIEKYDLLSIHQDKLIAVCSVSNVRIDKLKHSLRGKTDFERFCSFDKEIKQCFEEFGEVIGMSSGFISLQY